MPIIFSWLKYLSWMLYANEALSILQWEGIQNISKIFIICNTIWNTNINELSVCSQNNIITTKHFFIPACTEDIENLPCLQTGQDVMDNYNFSFESLYMDIWALIVLYLMFHLLSYLFLWKRAKRI